MNTLYKFIKYFLKNQNILFPSIELSDGYWKNKEYNHQYGKHSMLSQSYFDK